MRHDDHIVEDALGLEFCNELLQGIIHISKPWSDAAFFSVSHWPKNGWTHQATSKRCFLEDFDKEFTTLMSMYININILPVNIYIYTCTYIYICMYIPLNIYMYTSYICVRVCVLDSSFNGQATL